MRRERIPGEREPKTAWPEELAMIEKLRPYVRQSGDGVRRPWFMKSRKLLDYLLVGIGSGEGIFSVGERTFPVGKWDLIWVPPGTSHQMRGTSKEMRCLYTHFDLRCKPGLERWDACIPGGTEDLSAFESLAQKRGETGTVCDEWEGLLKLSNAPEAFSALRALCAERKREREGFNAVASGLLLQIIALIWRGMACGERGRDERMRKAAEALNDAERPREAGSLKSLASGNALSPSQFRRLYREAYGTSPREAALKARIQKACELLVYSERNVSETAAELGYANSQNFSRAFSREVGLSPLAYKAGRRPKREGKLNGASPRSASSRRKEPGS